MALGNRGFAGSIIGSGEGVAEPRRPPKTGILEGRNNRLAELATGTSVARIHESVDPAVCKIWDGHNRDYSALNEETCRDLIDSLRAQGRQEVPAIVRRLKGDAGFSYEVICGARRHWSVAWLRAHDRPDLKFLVEPRELNDEEAFRIADLENRSRSDLSDYERATDYARAIERYYGGSQQRMVERLQVTKSWLSRYLELAKLPSEVVACFQSPHVIKITHAAALAPVLSHPMSRDGILAEASRVAADQLSAARSGAPPIPPARVVARLLSAKPRSKVYRTDGPEAVRDPDGKLVLSVRRERGGSVTFVVPKDRLGDPRSVLDAIEAFFHVRAHTPMKKVRVSPVAR